MSRETKTSMAWSATHKGPPPGVPGDLGVVMSGGPGASPWVLSVSPRQADRVTKTIGKPYAGERVLPDRLARGWLR
jgi:hypothetical protein